MAMHIPLQWMNHTSYIYIMNHQSAIIHHESSTIHNESWIIHHESYIINQWIMNHTSWNHQSISIMYHWMNGPCIPETINSWSNSKPTETVWWIGWPQLGRAFGLLKQIMHLTNYFEDRKYRIESGYLHQNKYHCHFCFSEPWFTNWWFYLSMNKICEIQNRNLLQVWKQSKKIWNRPYEELQS